VISLADESGIISPHMAGVPRGRARGGRLLNRAQGFFFFDLLLLQSSEPRHFIRLTYHAYNFEKKRNKIVSGVSLRLPFAWPRVDRPSHLLSSARPPGSSAWLACRPARPLSSPARLVRSAPGMQLSCALFR
jgi:hypothetical protein